jgi:hypothetical protein
VAEAEELLSRLRFDGYRDVYIFDPATGLPLVLPAAVLW